MTRRTVAPATALVFTIVAAACGAAAASPSGPAPTQVPSGIAHPTGANEIVLRFDQAGGFVPAEFFAAHVPLFTLYGDGTVVFVSAGAAVDPTPNGVSTGQPVRTAHMTEAQIQSLLQFALRDGGLAVARTDYQNPNVADAPTAVFEIHADDDSKTVSVVALGLGGEPGPDTAILTALASLGERLGNFDQGGTLASDPYVPAGYRGVLLDANGVQGVPVRAWPWATLSPAEFVVPAGPGGPQRPTHRLTVDEAAALGVPGFENGVTAGLWLQGPDGTTYSFVLRPLLPDETA